MSALSVVVGKPQRLLGRNAGFRPPEPKQNLNWLPNRSHPGESDLVCGIRVSYLFLVLQPQLLV